MASPQTLSSDAFSPDERFLIEKTEDAIRDGHQLERWCYQNDRAGKLKLFPLDLQKKFRLPNRAEGFFDWLEISGRKFSVMGCVQSVDFGRLDGDDAASRLKNFVLREFLPRSHWTYQDGYPGGFTLEQSLFRSASGGYGRFTGESAKGCVDLRELGPAYDWVLVTVHIHDFVMDFGPYRKHFKEAACVAPGRQFVHITENPSPDCVLEIGIGYPFVKVAPIPNHFGFGPGKFEVAVKTYIFRLNKNHEVKVRMHFAAAPRCQRVFDFGPIPDPVYGGARLLSRLTLGAWKDQPFHDRLDGFMVGQHSRVHQYLMDGAAKVFAEWVRGGGA